MHEIRDIPPLPPRPISGHKGLFGRVLIVGGSEGMIGAPALAGRAALRLGAGLVELAVPRTILSSCLSLVPELIGLGLGRDAEKEALTDHAELADAVAVGPGMGRFPESHERVRALIRLKKPMVIDADALNILSEQKRWPRSFRASAVLTPHPGEMKRLAKLLKRKHLPDDDEQRIELAAEAARTFGQVVVLKGHHTVITDGQSYRINQTGDSSLSKAGTGDVLCGMIACLLAQGMDRMSASILAVHLHGLAGEIAGRKLGRRCVLAGDVIDTLPQAVAQIEPDTPSLAR